MVNSNMKNLKNSKTSIILKRFLLSLFEFDFEKELTLLSQIEKNILILNPTYFQQVKVFIESGVKYHYPQSLRSFLKHSIELKTGGLRLTNQLLKFVAFLFMFIVTSYLICLPVYDNKIDRNLK